MNISLQIKEKLREMLSRKPLGRFRILKFKGIYHKKAKASIKTWLKYFLKTNDDWDITSKGIEQLGEIINTDVPQVNVQYF